MKPEERWPLLSLVAGHVFYLGPPEDFREMDRMELDQTKLQLCEWLREVAGERDDAALKERVRVATFHRYRGGEEQLGLQAWHDYVFLYDRTEVLIEEVLSCPTMRDSSQPPIRMRKFSRKRFSECSDEVRALFPEER